METVARTPAAFRSVAGHCSGLGLVTLEHHSASTQSMDQSATGFMVCDPDTAGIVCPSFPRHSPTSTEHRQRLGSLCLGNQLGFLAPKISSIWDHVYAAVNGRLLGNAAGSQIHGVGGRFQPRHRRMPGSRRLAHPYRTAIAQIRALTGSSASSTPEALKPAATSMPCQPGVTLRGPYAPLCQNRPTNRIRHARRPLPAHS